ncbi:pyruvate formate lyase-activating enzyme 1 [bacterium BMS3Bbin03]|nr:pyruvate formate lyase-activating enzyme 1 [bacterium BMS3Bbin03]
MDRRKFLEKSILGGAALGISAASPLAPGFAAAQKKTGVKDLIDQKHIFEAKEAQFYKKLEHGKIRCHICPRKCEVDNMERGFCGNRENRDGTYYVLAYGNPCAAHIDPIEKKPFFHFLPGTQAFSIATAGCNLVCKFCQNWQISQFRPEQTENIFLPPDKAAGIAKERRITSIAYTYAEPVVFYEYMYDTSIEARRNGVKSVMVSAGFINPDPMRKLVKKLDAVKIDLKAFTEKYYQEVCSAELKPVLQTLEVLKDEKIWFEIVYLVVPTLNDSREEVRNMSRWIMKTLGPDVPLHFSRFYPQYMLKNLPPTPVSTLETLRKTAMDEGIDYVYIGNVPGNKAESTYCPHCGKRLIYRIGYQVIENKIKNGACPYCRTKIPGVWI